MSPVVHLGYEVGSGKPVEIPILHTVITGQTQLAGKTTTLEALIDRANLPAIAFVTKRGERSFGDGRRIQPYFRERADWQFVVSVLEATMRERLKFERAWIMRASKGARTLAEVQHNVRGLIEKAKGLSADVYMTLDAYLEIVVPRVAGVRFADRLDLEPGLNVLDLSDRDRFPPELQSLVMRSALEWVYERCDGTITIIPEAWEFLPQGRGSPVKLSAIELIRKGAGLHNYVWLDSQDIGGVDKELLRSCPVWLLGVQRETNEIKRVLDNIPAGIAKPKPQDVATLEKGQFYACFGRHVIKTYVQPKWMDAAQAAAIARGELAPESVTPPPPPSPSEDPETMSKAVEDKLDRLTDLLGQHLVSQQRPVEITDRSAQVVIPGIEPPARLAAASDEEAMYQRFKARLTKEAPGLIKLMVNRPEIKITEQRTTVEMDLTSAKGMVAKLMSEGFLDRPVTSSSVWNELKRRWNYKGISARAYEQLEWFASNGFATKEADGYQAVPGMKSNILKA